MRLPEVHGRKKFAPQNEIAKLAISLAISLSLAISHSEQAMVEGHMTFYEDGLSNGEVR